MTKIKEAPDSPEPHTPHKKTSLIDRQVSTKTFLVSQLLILLFGFGFIGAFYYILNTDYNPNLAIEENFAPVTRKPKNFNLEINSPEDNLLSFEKSVLISGSTTPNSVVLITNGANDFATEANVLGEFSRVISLNIGQNNLEINSFDEFGTNRTVKRDVYYSEEKL